MTVIRQDDFIDSVADALQFISYYHPVDFCKKRCTRPTSVSRTGCERRHGADPDQLPHVRRGPSPYLPGYGDRHGISENRRMNVRWDATMSVADMVNEGVRRAYTNPDNVLRASILEDPAGARRNTRDNTPAVIHMEVIAGDTVDVQVAAKGGGSGEQVKLVMLNPLTALSTGWSRRSRPWVPAGVRRECWASVSAAPPRKRRYWPKRL